MPRSPRATMIPLSAARMIASAFSAACGFSIFAISGMSAPADPHAALDRLQVLGAADERDRQQVDSLLDREVDPVQVGVAGGGQRDLGPGHVQSLVGGDRAPDLDRAADLAGRRPEHPQPHPAVGEVDLVAFGDRVRQPLPGDGQVIGAADLLAGGQGQLGPRVEARPRLPRPRRSAASGPGGRRAGRPRGRRPRDASRAIATFCGVLVAPAVREVEAEDVGSGPDQLRHRLDRAGGGADRGDDLRAAAARSRRIGVGLR